MKILSNKLVFQQYSVPFILRTLITLVILILFSLTFLAVNKILSKLTLCKIEKRVSYWLRYGKAVYLIYLCGEGNSFIYQIFSNVNSALKTRDALINLLELKNETG